MYVRTEPYLALVFLYSVPAHAGLGRALPLLRLFSFIGAMDVPLE